MSSFKLTTTLQNKYIQLLGLFYRWTNWVTWAKLPSYKVAKKNLNTGCLGPKPSSLIITSHSPKPERGLDPCTISAWSTTQMIKPLSAGNRLPSQQSLEAPVFGLQTHSSMESLNFLKGWRHLERWPPGQSLQFIPISACSSSPTEGTNSSCSCTFLGPPMQSGHLGDPCPPGTRMASVWPHPRLTAGAALAQTAGTPGRMEYLSPTLPYKWRRERKQATPVQPWPQRGQVPGI